MSISEKENFKVEIVKKSDESIYEDFLSPENKIYICSEPNTTFYIRMIAKDPFISYGVKLYLDGKEYPHSKVFKKIGHYFGFKLGYGKYKEFLFKKTTDLPDLLTKDNEKIKEKEVLNEEIKGTIKLDFYETKKVYKKVLIKEPAKYIPHKPSEKNDDKKLCFNSTTILEGGIVDLKLHEKWLETFYKSNKEKPFYYDYVLDEEKKIDTITIYYMEFISMILNGLLSLSNINHLYLAPDDNLEYCLQSIETILKYYHPRTFKLDDLPGLYFQYTRKNIETFLKGYSLKKFVERFTNRFFVIDDSLRINSRRLNNFVNNINVDYILTPNEKEFIKMKPQLIKELNENYINELKKQFDNKNSNTNENDINEYSLISIKGENLGLSPIKKEKNENFCMTDKTCFDKNEESPDTCNNEVNSTTIFDSFINKKRFSEIDQSYVTECKDINDVMKIKKELSKINKFKKIIEAEKEVVCINLLEDD